MACLQSVLLFHPDQKEFLESFRDMALYKEALPEYKNNVLTQIREWWVKHFIELRIIAVVSIVVGGFSIVSLVKSRTRAQHGVPGDAQTARAPEF